jgi:hypothetical protein
VFVMGETVVDQNAELSHAFNVSRRLETTMT